MYFKDNKGRRVGMTKDEIIAYIKKYKRENGIRYNISENVILDFFKDNNFSLVDLQLIISISCFMLSNNKKHKEIKC